MDFVSSYRVSFLGMTPTYKLKILDVIIEICRRLGTHIYPILLYLIITIQNYLF